MFVSILYFARKFDKLIYPMTSMKRHIVSMAILLLISLYMILLLDGVSDNPRTLNHDGVWCWFQDERALIHNDTLFVASISSMGEIQITSWNFRTDKIYITTIKENFPKDDHNVPGILLRNDGHLMAFYCKHHQEPIMYYRVSAKPYDARDWEKQKNFSAGVTDYFTYANPYELRGELGKIYIFWRGMDFNPTWSASDDNGETWRTGANHIYFKKGQRPYVKYASNGLDTIHFAFIEAHPESMDTSLYHAYYRDGNMYSSHGEFLKALSSGPIFPSEATMVYNSTTNGGAEVWDISLDLNGSPSIVFTTQHDPDNVKYCYARWNSSAWVVEEIAFAGCSLYKDPKGNLLEGQDFFAGGITLDPVDPNIVYISSNANPTTGIKTLHYEIYEGTRSDEGSWVWKAITSHSDQDNLRPMVPMYKSRDRVVLWLKGYYSTYTDYKMEIIAYLDSQYRSNAK